MFSAWTVGIRMIATSNFGLVAAGIARSAAGAEGSVGGLKRQINGIGVGGTFKAAAGIDAVAVAAGRAEARTAALNRTMGLANRGIQAFGVASAITLAVGIKGASDLQQKVNQLSISLGQSPEYIDKKYTPKAMQYTAKYGSSVSESMDQIRGLSTIFKTESQMNAVMPTAMAFANAMHRGPDKMDRVDAIKSFGKVSHMMGAYDAESSSRIAESLAKKGYASAGSMHQMINQLGYFSEMWSRAGVKPEKILQAAIFGDLTLPNKYGAAYDQLYKNIIEPTKPMMKAQIQMGIRDKHGSLQDGIFDQKGHFDPMAFFASGEKHTHGLTPQQISETFYKAFNVRSVRAAIQGANPKALAYNTALGKAIAKEPGLAAMNKQLMHDLFVETDRLAKAFASFATMLSRPWMETFISAVSRAADALSGLAKYMHDHPTVAKATGGVLMAGVAAFGVSLALAGANFVHFFATLGKHPHFGAGVGKVFGHGGGRFATVAAEGAGVIAKRSIVGRVAVGAAGLFGLGGGMKAIGGIRPFISSFAKVGELFASFGLKTLTTRGGLMLLAEVIGKIGLRAIPVVGNILMVIDVLRFLVTHTKDIGKGIGIAARWIVTSGIPLIVGAFKSLVFGIFDVVKKFAMYTSESYKGLVTGSFKGGIFDTARSFKGGVIDSAKGFVDGVKEGFNSPGASAASTPAHIEHRRERTRSVVHNHSVVNFNVTAPHGNQADVERALRNQHRALADAVAEAHAKTLRTSGRAAGQSPGMSGMSGFEFAGAPG